MPSFLDLPIELHLEIFYALPTTNDALRLARTCSQLHGLFSNRKTKINILRFAAGVPGKFSYGRECALADITRIPPTRWWLKDAEDYLITLIVDFSPFSEECMMNSGVRDMASICNGIRKSEHQHPIFEFLDQFVYLDRRCPNVYEPFTFEILKGAAQLQKSILSEMQVIPEDLSTHVTIIALLLNCLVISLRIFDWTCSYPPRSDLFSPSTYNVTFEEAYQDNYHGLVPFLAVRRQRPTSKALASLTQEAWDLDSTIESTLQLAAQLMLGAMVKQDPKDLPMILYALCIMRLIQSNVGLRSHGDRWKDLPHSGKSLFSDLCRLFYICTYGGQPLKRNFNREAYANLVDNDSVAIRHCNLLRASWLDADYCDDFEGLSNIHTKIEACVLEVLM